MDQATDQIDPTPKKRRGFAGMTPEKVREIASKGGKAAQAAGTAHRFSHDEAQAAGRKGGLAKKGKRKTAPAEPAP